MRLFAITFVLCLAACSIDHRSDSYACAVQTDCASGRVCTDGLCLVGGGSGSGASCPTGCTSCNVDARTCMIDNPSRPICPQGWSCTINCTGTGSCDRVDCNDAAACTVNCVGRESCKELSCTSSDCNVFCNGGASCEAVDCRDACACDVSCAPGACPGRPACPAPSCSTPTGCTSTGASCTTC